MRKIKQLTLLSTALLTSTTFFAQEKKWNYGFHFGSDQYFASKAKANPFNYKLENTHSYKMGIFAERNLNEKESVLIGLNYNLYYLESSEQYQDYMLSGSKTLENFLDLDLQYNRNIGRNFRYFGGLNVAFQPGHSNYATLGSTTEYYRAEGNATDFNIGLNTGLKYTINPKSKFKIEPYVMIGVNLFKKDKEEIQFYPSNTVQQNSLSNFYTRFGVNFRF